MKTLNVILFFLLVFSSMAAAAEVKPPAVLLQEGIYAEESEGNLDKAMQIYSQIREKYNDVERISAIATYQLGLCYLKKNDNKKAAQLFQEVVGYYPEQTSAVKKAQQQLDKMGIKKADEGNFFEILGQISAYIGSKYGEISAEAGTKKLYSNCHIYLADNDFVLRTGGMGYIYNWTTEAITKHYRISGTSNPSQKLYDVVGNPMDTEIVPDENRSGFYNIYWNPKEPIQPGGYFYYGWAMDGSKPLSAAGDEGSYPLKMQNRFGDHCYETFFLVVPQGTAITSQSEEYTNKGNLNGRDIYWWKKEVPENNDHVVNVTLKKTAQYTQEMHNEIEPNGTIKFSNPSHIKNKGTEPITNTSFINSDFVSLEKIVDDKGRPIKLTASHEGNIYRYNLTFNEPIMPDKELIYTTYGTITGLISPVPAIKDVYQYYMNHSPNSGVPTLRIETYLLPAGAELISTTPPNMQQTEKNGRIELRVEKIIPAGGSLTTAFQYKLVGAKRDVSQNELETIVQKAVLTISTCAESDPRVALSLNSLKGIDHNLVVSELAKYLDDPTATVRRSAIFILWKGGFDNIAPAEEKLLKLCKHEENFTRGMAAIALGATKTSSSFETLKEMTLNDKDGYVRRCAAYALGLYGDKEALPVLEKALGDEDQMVKNNAQAAITMLTKLNDPNLK